MENWPDAAELRAFIKSFQKMEMPTTDAWSWMLYLPPSTVNIEGGERWTRRICILPLDVDYNRFQN
jgi:hypothetical protein